MSNKPAYDVVIIGTGATASLVANHFVNNNKQVLILEKGADRPYAPKDRSDYWFEGVEANIRGKHLISRNAWSGLGERHSDMLPESFEQEKFPHLVEIENVHPEFRFNYNMRLGYGGSSAVWSGRTWRFYDSDFKTRSLFNYGQDWPFTESALRPYYDKAEAILHVSGPAQYARWPFAHNFQYDAFPPTYLDKQVSSLFTDNYVFYPTANAVKNTSVEKGGCVAAKSCVQFCPNNALTRHYIEFLEPIRHRDNCTLQFDTTVTHLDVDPNSHAVTEIHCISTQQVPSVITISPKTAVFMCANTIENLRILLNANKVTGKPIANSNGLLGRYFASHGAVVAEIIMDSSLKPAESRPSTSAGLDKYYGKWRQQYSSHMLEIFNFNWRYGSSHVALQKVRRETGDWGRTLFNKAAFLDRTTMVAAIFEVEMRHRNRIELSELTDRYGVPLAKCNFKLSERDEKTFAFLQQYLRGIQKRPHCESSKVTGWGLNGNHPMGGYIMSNNPQQGVTDHIGRTHDHPNLFLMGGGLFNSTSTFNPTLTITANTLRTLDLYRDL